MYIGALAEEFSVSGETSACAVGRLEKMDKDLLIPNPPRDGLGDSP